MDHEKGMIEKICHEFGGIYFGLMMIKYDTFGIANMRSDIL